MAYSNQLRNIALKANADFSSRQYHIVELTGNPQECQLAAAGTGIGVLQNHPQSGEHATVAVEGESRCRAGGTIAQGAWVTAANTGFATAVASGATSTRAIGKAMSGAASGSIFPLHIQPFLTASGAAN